MNNEEIRELLDMIQKTDVTELQIEREGVKVRVRRDRFFPAVESIPLPAHTHAPAASPGGGETVDLTTGEETRLRTITSPIVGTFYRSSSPESSPFVDVGETVNKGQVLCIIEAMKLMNEIESDTDGTITKILVENGQAVEYGEPLFLIDPA